MIFMQNISIELKSLIENFVHTENDGNLKFEIEEDVYTTLTKINITDLVDFSIGIEESFKLKNEVFEKLKEDFFAVTYHCEKGWFENPKILEMFNNKNQALAFAKEYIEKIGSEN